MTDIQPNYNIQPSFVKPMEKSAQKGAEEKASKNNVDLNDSPSAVTGRSLVKQTGSLKNDVLAFQGAYECACENVDFARDFKDEFKSGLIDGGMSEKEAEYQANLAMRALLNI